MVVIFFFCFQGERRQEHLEWTEVDKMLYFPAVKSKRMSAQSVELSSFLNVHLSPEEHNLPNCHCQTYERGIRSFKKCSDNNNNGTNYDSSSVCASTDTKKGLQLAP